MTRPQAEGFKVSGPIYWPALKKALYRAAVTYLEDPLVRKKCGFFHGETGRNRATNLMRETADGAEIKNDRLFLLFAAVFESSSNSLARRLAHELFEGEYSLVYDQFAVPEESVKDTLSSEVFLDPLLNQLKRPGSFALKTTVITECYWVKVFDPHWASAGIVKKLIAAYKKAHPKSGIESDIENTKKWLEKKHKGETGVEMSPFKTSASAP